MSVENIVLPSGKKMNIGAFNLKTIAEFSSVYSFRMPYKKMPPKNRKEAIKKDWDFIRSKTKKDELPKTTVDTTKAIE